MTIIWVGIGVYTTWLLYLWAKTILEIRSGKRAWRSKYPGGRP